MDNNILFISDLDGTLLTKDQSLSQTTLQGLNDLIDQGLQFTFATARAYISALRVLPDLKLKLPYILHNGVFTFDPDSKEYIREKILDSAIIPDILQFYQEHNMNPIVYGFDKNGESKVFYPSARNPAEELYITTRLNEKDPRFQKGYPNDFSEYKIYEINIIETPQITADLQPRVLEKFNVSINLMTDVYYPSYRWMEITHPEATKFHAVEHLRSILKPTKIICFGDNYNDFGLFKAADEAYAVGNAVDELKSMATGILETNENDGVFQFLNSYIS